MTEQVKPKKKRLKLLKKLPRVQVGTILNVFWTNGSYEKPSNPLTKKQIDDNFIDVAVKIDWLTKDTGNVTLKGVYNYLIYKGGEYYFLTPIRPIDISKQEYVYSVVMDVSMTILKRPKLIIQGALTRTTHEATLLENLSSTKPLVEDFDEVITIPLEKKEVVVVGKSYKSFDINNFKKVKCFSSKKLAWIIGHFTHPDAKEKIKKYMDEGGTTKLFFNCEFDSFLPYSTILEHIKSWLNSGQITLTSVKDRDNGFREYSQETQAKIKSLYSNWTKVYALSNIKSPLETIQKKYIFEVNEEKALDIDNNFFEDVNEMVPLDPKTFEPLQLNNRHIFDMMEDAVLPETTVSQFGSYYELTPRAYTDLENFEQHNKAVVSKPLSYSLSLDELEKIGHLTDTKQDDKDGKSIINNINISYYPDWWYNKSWSNEALNRLQDSVLNKNPTVGFILYDIFDYWLYTRGSDVSRRYSNMYDGGHKGEQSLSMVFLTTGIKFYNAENNDAKIELLAQFDEDKITLIKSDKSDINFGFLTSQECKQLNSALDVYIMYTFLHDIGTLESIDGEFAKKFRGNFLTYAKTENYEVIGYKGYTGEFDLTKQPIDTKQSVVQGVNNMELVEHCWNNYDKIRKLSTQVKTFTFPEPLVKGDLFWSNVAWCFQHNLNKKVLDIKTEQFAFLICDMNDLSGKHDFRFSKISPINGNVGLTETDNLILSEEIREDVYPWIVYEKKYNLFASTGEKATIKEETYEARKTYLKNFVREFGEIVWEYIHVYNEHDLNKLLEKEKKQLLEQDPNIVAKAIGIGSTPVITGGLAAGATVTGVAGWTTAAHVLAVGAKYGLTTTTIALGVTSAVALPVALAVAALTAAIVGLVYILPRPYVRVHPWWLDGYWYGTKSLGYGYFIDHMNKYIDDNYKKDGYIYPKNYMWQFNYSESRMAETRRLVEDEYKSSMGNTPYLPTFSFEDEKKNVIGTVWINSVDTSLYAYEQYVALFEAKMESLFVRWRYLELDYYYSLYKGLEFSRENVYDNITYLLSPSKEVRKEFDAKVGGFGIDVTFEQKIKEGERKEQEINGQLSLTLATIYENMHIVSGKRDKLNYYWTDVKLSDIRNQKEADKKLYVFALRKNNQGKKIDKAYVLMLWNEQSEEFLTQIIINDDKVIKPVNINIDIPIQKITNPNLYQCINQKNYLYVYGNRIPIKSRVMLPFIKEPFEIYINTLTTISTLDKYKINVKTPSELIDTKISVPKRVVTLGREVLSYVDLERLKLDISEREENKALSIAAGDEKARILREKLQNAKDELAFQQVIGPFNVIGNAVMGAARVARFAVPNPENKMDNQSNVAASLLTGATSLQLATGFAQYGHSMVTGKRDIEQMDAANTFTIAHDKNTLDSKHKHEELREKIKILELNSNYSDSTPGEDDVELKTSNKLLFGDEKIDFGFIHYRPAADGKLMNYIINFYSRYGVEIFVNNFVLESKIFIDGIYSIWQFDSITSINIINHSFSEKVKRVFMNGVKFIFTEYKFDDPKLTFDDSYIIKKEWDDEIKIDETRRLLIAKGRIDNELSEQVRIAKEHLDAANSEYQKLETKVQELEAQIAAGGCSKEVTDQLEKYKNSASFLSEQKMALEEQVTSLTNQLALEKRKMEAANQQIVNAGTKNLDLVRKMAAANAAKTQAEAARDQAVKERDASNALYSTAAEELRALRVEKDRLEKEEKGDLETLNKYKAAIDELSKKKTRLVELRNLYGQAWDKLIQVMENLWETHGSYNWVRMCGQDWYMSDYEFIYANNNPALYDRKTSSIQCGPWFNIIDGTTGVLPALTSDIKIDQHKVYKEGSYEGISFYVPNTNWALEFYLNSNLDRVSSGNFQRSIIALRGAGNDIIKYSRKIISRVKDISKFIRLNKDLYANPADAENYALYWENVNY